MDANAPAPSRRPGLRWLALLVSTILLAACQSSGPTSAGGPPSSRPAALSSSEVVTASPATGTAEPPSATTPPRPVATPPRAPTQSPTPAPTVSPAPRTKTRYVASGDTLSGLAARYGLSVEQILAANPRITDRSLIRVGDELTIPIGLTPIANATVELPLLPADGPPSLPSEAEAGSPFYCAEGRAAFSDGYAFPAGAERTWWHDSTWIDDVVRTDLDHDGTPDVVALIRCQPSQASFDRVVAFRPRPGGGFATFGLVVDPEPITIVAGLAATKSGEVRVEVSDFVGAAPELWSAVWQWRTYGWTGHAFVQVAGSRTFHVPHGSVNLTLSASMRFAAGTARTWVRTLSVTVRNDGAATVEDLSIVLPHYDLPWPEPPERTIRTLAPGTSVTLDFRERVSSSSCPNSWSAQVLVGDQEYDDIGDIGLTCE